jgi:hypothetical protein
MEGRAKPRAIGVVALSGASAKDSLPGGGTSSPCETGAEGISDSGPRPRRQLPGQACRKTGPDRPVMVHVGSDLPETQGLTWPYPLPMASPPVDGRSGSVRPSDANDTMAYRDVARAGPPRWLIGMGVTLAGAGLGYGGSWLLGSCTTCATGSSPALFAAVAGVVAGLAAAAGARG